MENLSYVLQNRIIAIVRGMPPGRMKGLAGALADGGIRLMEVTFDQKEPDAWKDTQAAIRMIADEFAGRILPGAGTVMTVEQLYLAGDAGAQYIISPNADEEVIRETKRLGLLSFPGALTPTEIANAHRWGADIVKVFPAGTLGGGYVKAVRAPISHIPLMAVGGINEKNLAEFLRAGCVGAGIGGSLVDRELVEGEKWDEIAALAREYVKIAEA